MIPPTLNLDNPSFESPINLTPHKAVKKKDGETVVFAFAVYKNRKHRDEVMKKTHGLYPAPLEILACVEKGLAGGMAAGQEEEAVRFGKLVGSEG